MTKNKILFCILILLLTTVNCSQKPAHERAMEIFRSGQDKSRYEEALACLDSSKLSKWEIQKYYNEIRKAYDTIRSSYEKEYKQMLLEKYGDTKIVFKSQDGRKMYVSKLDGSEQKLVYSRAPFESPRWSPDGKSIAFVSYSQEEGKSPYREIFIINEEGLSQMTDNNTEDQNPSWNGSELLFNRAELNIFLIDTKTKTETALFLSNPWKNNNPGLYPVKTSRGIVMQRNGALQVLENGRSIPQSLYQDDYQFFENISLSPEKNKLIMEHRGLFIYDLETGESTSIYREGHSPSWSPDEKYIMFSTFINNEVKRGIYITPIKPDPLFEDFRIFITEGSEPSWGR